RALHRGAPAVPADPVAQLGVLGEARAARADHRALRRPGARVRGAPARGGPVQLAWVLISGYNTGPEEALELARLFRGVRVRLSVIDVNDPLGGFERASDAERSRFLSALAENGIGFVRRYSGGPDIDAACGLLASRARGGQAHTPEPALS